MVGKDICSGGTMKYEELWLVREDGKRIDLLKEGWFKE